MLTDGFKFMIGGDASALMSELSKAKRATVDFFGSFGSGLGSVNGVLGQFAAALSVGALAVWTKGVVDGIDSLNDLKDAAGTTVENVSALEDIAARTGTRFEVVGSTLVKFNQVLTQSTDKGSATSKMLQGLGLDAEQLRKIDPAEALRQTAVALSQYADDGDKARVVQQLFGKSVAEMAPFLKDLAEQTELTATVTTKQAEEAEKLNRQFMALEKNTTDAARSLVSKMLPAINSVLEAMNNGGLRAGIDRLGNELFDWEGNAQRKAINNVKSEIEAETARVQQLMTGLALVLERDPTNAVAQRRMATLQANLDKSLESMKGRLKSAEQLYFKFDATAGGGRGVVNPALVDPRQSVGDLGVIPKEVKAVVSEYDKLIQKLGVDVPKAAAEAQAAQMGYNKAQTEFVALAGSPVWATFTNEQRAAVAVKYESIIVGEQAVDLAKEQAKAAADQTKAIAELRAEELKRVAATEQRVVGMQEGNLALQQEIELIGLNDEAQVRLLQQRNEAIILIKEATLAELERASAISGTMSREQIALEAEIAALRERNELMGAKHDKTVVAKATQEAANEWTKFTDSVYDGLTDSLYRGFESGKGFFKTFWDGIKNTAKTTVLKFGVQGVMTGVSGFLGFGSTAQAGAATSGASGVLSGVSALGSFGGTFGAGLKTGLSGLFGEAGLSGTISAGTTALGAGNIAGGLGTLAGPLALLGGGILALTSIIKATKGETRFGGGFEVVDGRAFRTTGDVTNTLPESAIVQSVQGTFDTINGLFKQYGSEFLATNIKAGIETSGKGRGGVFAGGLLEGLGGESIKFGKFFEDRIGASLNPEEAVKAFSGELNKAVIAALQTATDLPKFVQRQLEGIDVNTLGADKAAEVLQTLSNLPNVLLQGFGTTRDALVQQFTQGLALGDATAAGQSVADTLVASIEASLFTDASGKIFDIVNNGIVAPMLDAIATGASVSEALSQASIDKTIERAKTQAAALSELFGNAEFTAALEQIRATVGGALGQAGESFGYTPKFQLQAAQQIDTVAQSANKAAEDAARAAEDARRAWQDITDSLQGDRSQLDIDLLRAMGQEEQAVAAERARAIVGYDAYQVALYDSNQAIREQIAGLALAAEEMERLAELSRTLAAELPGVLDKFLTPEQRTAGQYSRIAGDLIAAGLSGLGVDQLAGALTSAGKDDIAAAAMAIYNMTGVTDEMRLALVRAAGGLADLKDSADAAGRADQVNLLDRAWQALERSAAAQRGLLQETINDVRGVFTLVSDSARSMYMQVDSTARMLGAEGRGFIEHALGAARSTGYLPEADQLRDAISAVTNDLGSQVYATQFDADRDRLVTAGRLAALAEISGEQLTEAEQQLQALDDLLSAEREKLELARKHLDATYEGTAATLSMGDAMTQWLAAFSKVMGGPVGGGGRGGGGAAPAPANYLLGANGAGYDVAADMGYLAGTGLPWMGADVREAAKQLLEAGNGRAVYDAVKAQGFTLAQADTFLDIPAGEAEAWARAMGLPVFHKGTNFVEETGLALLERGESVTPANLNPYNPAAMQWGGGGGTAEVVAELRALRLQNARLEGRLEKIEESNSTMAQQQDEVTDGGNVTRTEVMNVAALAKAIVEAMA